MFLSDSEDHTYVCDMQDLYCVFRASVNRDIGECSLFPGETPN